MSFECWLQAKSPGEGKRIASYLSPLQGEIRLEVEGATRMVCDLWLEGKRKIVLSYGIRSEILVDFVAREIARRFCITKVGSHAGWYKERSPAHWQEDYGHPYTSWADWRANFTMEHNYDMRLFKGKPEFQVVRDVLEQEGRVIEEEVCRVFGYLDAQECPDPKA